MSEYLSPTEALIQQLTQKNAKTPEATGKIKNTDKMNKYFKLTKEKHKVRILPIEEGSKVYIAPVWFHTLYVNGEPQRFLCLEKNEGFGGKCPSCDAMRELIDTQPKGDDPETQAARKEIYKQAMRNAPELYYAIRLIDRGQADAGVKFWFVRHSKTKDGVVDKIITKEQILSEKFPDRHFTDIENGFDLELYSGKAKTPQGREYLKLQMIEEKAPSRVIAEDDEYKEFLSSEFTLTWRDLVTPKKAPKLNIDEYEYMSLAVQGIAPYYDNDKKSWITFDVANTPAPSKVKDNDIDLANFDVDKFKSEVSNPPSSSLENDLPF